MPGEQVWRMNDDVVEDKRWLDSCKPRETFADQQGRLRQLPRFVGLVFG
jgi:hypothetical protein